MTAAELTRSLKDEAGRLGFALVGVARAEAVAEASRLAEWLDRGHHGSMVWMTRHFEKRTDPRELVPGCRSVVCVGLPYGARETHGPQGVRVARYAAGEDYHRVLKDKLRALLDYGRRLDAAFDGRAFVDSAPVMDRYWAERAGLGWRGKNTLLLNKRLGSFLFLGELLVTAELEPDLPGTDHCGTCTRCLDACPTGALVEPYLLDARECISYWTIEHRGELGAAAETAIGSWLFGCDICQEVCPWNQDAGDADEPRLAPGEAAWPDALDDLLGLDEREFERRYGDRAIERARRRGLVRNAAIVAGNTGLGSTAALERAAADPDPVVAATAGRALGRRGDRR
ncbi:MAG TPA: tRNA epoxyqueuosine(34) reductase QueG [Gemmatimonadota bacterium]|nr:tRNA epoxyqueuosine(34) reductase QueG [Gemmatimonadota bacterium]